MRIYKRVIVVLFCVISIFLLLPAQAADHQNLVSLIISCQDNGVPLTGVEFHIYLAAVYNAKGELTAYGDFAKYKVNYSAAIQSVNLASTLEGYVLRDSIKSTDDAVSDSHGYAVFPSSGKSLQSGLYLVSAKHHTQNGYYYDFSPFMVILSGSTSLDSVVKVNAKFDSEPEPTVPTTVTRKVLKVWDDDGHKSERPKSITVKLLKNGVVYDTVVLSAKNNWRYTWTGLSSGSKWNIVENENENYTVDVTREGVTFIVTNTYIEETPDPVKPSEKPPENIDTSDNPAPPQEVESPEIPPHSLPQTGQLWWPVPLLMAIGLTFILIGLIRRRGRTDD